MPGSAPTRSRSRSPEARWSRSRSASGCGESATTSPRRSATRRSGSSESRSLLQVVWLIARSEAWHVCVGAAGGAVTRRRLYRASSVGYLGNIFNANFGAGVRIAALRRSAPADSPCVSALIAAELPIMVVEGALVALCSFTLIGPLGSPGGCH